MSKWRTTQLWILKAHFLIRVNVDDIFDSDNPVQIHASITSIHVEVLLSSWIEFDDSIFLIASTEVIWIVYFALSYFKIYFQQELWASRWYLFFILNQISSILIISFTRPSGFFPCRVCFCMTGCIIISEVGYIFFCIVK